MMMAVSQTGRSKIPQQGRNDGSQVRFGKVLIGLAILASIAIRLPNLVSPLLERHAFRQTQTAFTVWCDLTYGFSILHPMTPVFGPPWEAPFECPIFQTCAATLAEATGFEVDLACRVTALIFFYTSAWALFVLTRRLLKDPTAALFIVLVYLFNPFSVAWSRASLIEFAAVTFALGYVHFVLRWLDEPARWTFFLAALSLGSLGTLTKITTMAICVPPIVLFSASHFYDVLKSRQGSNAIRSRCNFGIIGLWIAVLAIPIVVGQIWIWHADAIKSQSPIGRFLVSNAPLLTTWNYGTWAQRIQWHNWVQIFSRIVRYLIPYGFCAAPALAIARAPWLDRCARLFVASMAAALLLPICLFFNLYLIHDYYLCAIVACGSALTGFGLFQLYKMAKTWRASTTGARTTVVGVFVVMGAMQYRGVQHAVEYLRPTYTVHYDHPICQMGEALNRATQPDEIVILSGFPDWDPSILYYAKRRGLIGWQREASLETIRNNRFASAMVLCASPDPQLLSMWSKRTLVQEGPSLQVWQVSDYAGG
jgi:hypothetical protein